jgi:hypothetical protein
MDIKVKQCAVIKVLGYKRLIAEQIQPRLQAVYEDDVCALSSVYYWIRAFKTGRKGTVHDPRSDRLSLDHIGTQIL